MSSSSSDSDDDAFSKMLEEQSRQEDVVQTKVKPKQASWERKVQCKPATDEVDEEEDEEAMALKGLLADFADDEPPKPKSQPAKAAAKPGPSAQVRAAASLRMQPPKARETGRSRKPSSRSVAKAKPSECLHTIQIRGMCAVCGKVLEKTDTKDMLIVGQTDFDVTVTQGEAELRDDRLQHQLQQSRKLALVLDIDLTLLHATADASVEHFLNCPEYKHHIVELDVGILFCRLHRPLTSCTHCSCRSVPLGATSTISK
jgi:hypothetical protein